MSKVPKSTARKLAAKKAWAGRQASADVLNGVVCRRIGDFRARHGLDSSPATAELWDVYNRVRNKAQQQTKPQPKRTPRPASVPVVYLMRTGMVPTARSTRRTHQRKQRGSGPQIIPGGLPTLGKGPK